MNFRYTNTIDNLKRFYMMSLLLPLLLGCLKTMHLEFHIAFFSILRDSCTSLSITFITDIIKYTYLH